MYDRCYWKNNITYPFIFPIYIHCIGWCWSIIDGMARFSRWVTLLTLLTLSSLWIVTLVNYGRLISLLGGFSRWILRLVKYSRGVLMLARCDSGLWSLHLLSGCWLLISLYNRCNFSFSTIMAVTRRQISISTWWRHRPVISSSTIARGCSPTLLVQWKCDVVFRSRPPRNTSAQRWKIFHYCECSSLPKEFSSLVRGRNLVFLLALLCTVRKEKMDCPVARYTYYRRTLPLSLYLYTLRHSRTLSITPLLANAPVTVTSGIGAAIGKTLSVVRSPLKCLARTYWIPITHDTHTQRARASMRRVGISWYLTVAWKERFIFISENFSPILYGWSKPPDAWANLTTRRVTRCAHRQVLTEFSGYE